MAKQTRGTSGFSTLFGDFRSANSFRGQSLAGPADAATGPAITTLLEIAGLMNVLPGAAVASQQRELERLKATRGDDDPRVVELEAALARAATLQETAERGNARIQRAAVAFTETEDVFHGFVSDPELNPLPNYTVRVANKDTATTGADGYFRISLGTKAVGRGGDILRPRLPLGGTTPPGTAEPAGATVEVLQKSTVVYTDPVLLPLDRGRVYREYVIPQDTAVRDDVRATPRATTSFREAPARSRAKKK